MKFSYSFDMMINMNISQEEKDHQEKWSKIDTFLGTQFGVRPHFDSATPLFLANNLVLAKDPKRDCGGFTIHPLSELEKAISGQPSLFDSEGLYTFILQKYPMPIDTRVFPRTLNPLPTGLPDYVLRRNENTFYTAKEISFVTWSENPALPYITSYRALPERTVIDGRYPDPPYNHGHRITCTLSAPEYTRKK